ncbi:hypothetical protein HYX04_04805 [Candidatus Woesearchaeota archaeon]|nr:hypothetical protein [Candidatus Woesearchaeota archaeon]
MAEEEFVPYKDISELKRELEGMKGRKDVPAKDIYDAVQKLAQTMTDMLEVFGAATEQMRLEEREYESEARKHEMIISKLDKLIEQNRTIAEGMVAIVEMIKEKIAAPAKERQESMFAQPKEEQLFKPRPFMKPEWQPRPEPVQRQPMMAPPQMATPSIPQPMPPPDFGTMPPMEPEPTPDLNFPEEPFLLDQEPKKKGLFGMFKK